MDWPIAGDILLDESAAAKRPRASGAAFRPRELQIWQGTHLKWPWGARTLRSIHCGRLLSRRRRKVDTVEVSKKPTPRLRLSSTAGGRGEGGQFSGICTNVLEEEMVPAARSWTGDPSVWKERDQGNADEKAQGLYLEKVGGSSRGFHLGLVKMDLFEEQIGIPTRNLDT